MSAIFGIINKNGEPVNKEVIKKMQESLLHRAVDGNGIYTDGPMMFGHHKLTVHRRMANEKQPFVWEDFVITCDARIDNIDELFEKLGIMPAPETYTDSFIILEAYKKWGVNCVNHLDGEFCFCIWNKVHKMLFSASDHIGFRTFYYYSNDDYFLFSSEIKAIEAVKGKNFKLNKEIFLNFWRSLIVPITFDKEIHILQAGHYFKIDNESKTEIKQYWNLKKRKSITFNKRKDWYSHLSKLITNKIRYQIDSDYPIGILLSGGLDSSLVAAIACKLLKEEGKKLHAFCSVHQNDYSGPEQDEKLYIEKLKEWYDNLEVHYVSIPNDISPYTNLKKTFDKMEAPISIFHYVDTALYDAAKKLNIRVLLSGFGGDETISDKGEGVIYHYFTRMKIMKLVKILKDKRKIEKQGYLRLVKTEIFRHFTAYRTLSNMINHKKGETQKIPFKKIVKKTIEKNSIPSRIEFFTEAVNAGEIGFILLLIKKYARNFNLEHHSPFLDKNIVNFFVNIPQELVLVNGVKRSLIRSILEGNVPIEILNRMDKSPISPDYRNRISKINVEFIQKFLINREDLEETTHIDLSKLSDLISNSKDENFSLYIPSAILIGEFYMWLNCHMEDYN